VDLHSFISSQNVVEVFVEKEVTGFQSKEKNIGECPCRDCDCNDCSKCHCDGTHCINQ